MLIDYHLHNHFSPDSKTDTAALLEAERIHGVRHVCITNHAEWFPREEETPGVFNLDEATDRFRGAIREAETVRPRYPDMDIRVGVEMQYQKDFLPDMERLLKKIPFDFVLGSVHIIDGLVISGGKNAHKAFEPRTERQAYTLYFEELQKLVEWGQIDAVAHFDIIKKYGHVKYGPFDPHKYKTPITRILKIMKTKGSGMELNAGSLHKRCFELFPHPEILKWALKEGIEHFTFGSDAHETARAGTYIKEVAAIAKEVGIQYVTTYLKRIPTKHPIL